MERDDILCHVSRVCLPSKQLCSHSTCAIRLHKYSGRSGNVVIAGNIMGSLIGDMWNLQCERSDRRYVGNDDSASLCNYSLCNG